MQRLAVAAAAALVLVAPARADAVIDAIRAEAGALAPRPFERTRIVRDTRDGDAPRTEVDRFDPKAPRGQQWTLVSVDGRAPSEDERKAHAKFVNDQAVIPGPWRLDPLLAGPNPKVARDGETTTYNWSRLPKGSLPLSRFDLTSNLAAQATVADVGGKPTVTRLRIYAPEPFRVLAIARIERMTVESDYARGADGRLQLTRQVMVQDGNIPGRGKGTLRTEMRFRPL
jgi:hypothetical protein